MVKLGDLGLGISAAFVSWRDAATPQLTVQLATRTENKADSLDQTPTRHTQWWELHFTCLQLLVKH